MERDEESKVGRDSGWGSSLGADGHLCSTRGAVGRLCSITAPLWIPREIEIGRRARIEEEGGGWGGGG